MERLTQPLTSLAAVKFKPDPDTLDPPNHLFELAKVKAEDVAAAAADWKKDPPDDEFANLLEAEVQ